MSVLHVRQIASSLETRFNGLIDISDIAGAAEQQKTQFKTRAIAAYALVYLAACDNNVAGQAITDQFSDNGIDAIYFDSGEAQLYVVQSKFVQNGTSGIESAEVLKFVQGVRDLLDGDFKDFGSKMKARQSDVLSALDSASTRIVLVLAHTSIQKLAGPSLKPISDLLEDLNDASEVARFVELRQADIHGSLAGTAEGAPIDLDVMLTEWGQVKEPHKAFYGQVSVNDVASWYEQHGDRLFAKNLRKMISVSDINRTIAETAQKKPASFWYYNNGITALCQTLEKKPIGGNDRTSGVFECSGVSIVNGAQTVGSLAAAALPQSDAKVMVRFISLEQCPPDFATEVTRATNMQNRVDARDFAALDPEQDRLRRELLLDGKTYAYKTGDPVPTTVSGCTLEDATIALACASNEVSFAVIAKSAIGRLWDDIGKPPYRLLFNSGLSGLRLWRLVELLRVIDDALRDELSTRTGRERMVAVHGNRFVAHRVFRQLTLTKSELDDPDHDVTALHASASRLVSKELVSTAKAIKRLFAKSYIQSLFKNSSKCQELADSLESVSAKTKVQSRVS
jgi:hypothetical protein